MTTLATPRLILRPVVEADVDAIFAGCSNPRVTEHTIFETHTSRADSESFYRDYALKNYEQNLPDPFAIALKSEPGHLIGCCGGKWTETRCNRSVEFGYWIAEPHWNRGYATEAVRALVPFLFEHFAPQRVQAHVNAVNRASARVLEKAGLSYEGTFRQAAFRRGRFWDVMMYSILASELPAPGPA